MDERWSLELVKKEVASGFTSSFKNHQDQTATVSTRILLRCFAVIANGTKTSQWGRNKLLFS